MDAQRVATSSLSTHSFSVYGVSSKEQSCSECWPHRVGAEHHCTELHIQIAHHCMEHHIHQVVAHGVQPMQQVVQSEGSHAERPVRLVAAFPVHRSAPEVMVEQVGPGSGRSEVAIPLHSLQVIETKPTAQTVEVEQ